MNLEDIKLEYIREELHKKDLAKSPFEQLNAWMQEVIKSEITYPHAAYLATVDQDNYPDNRTVLLKEFDENGLYFYTDYLSKKGQDLETTPKATMLFFWKEFDRQVKVQGTTQKVSREKSEHYFASRPHDSKLSASIAHQSIPMSKEEIDKKIIELAKTYENSQVPCPKNWGGYLLSFEKVEFWQGRPNRLHDRFIYEKKDGQWEVTRLTP